MNIRPCRPEEEAAVIALWQACGLTRPWNDPRKDVARKLAAQPDLFLVGEEDGQIVAAAMCGYEGHRGSVNYLGVLPSHRGKGYGRAMMEHIQALLLARGCPKINLLVRTGNEQVLAFYRELGYAPDEAVSLSLRLISDE